MNAVIKRMITKELAGRLVGHKVSRPVIVHYSRPERVVVRHNSLAKYSTGQLASELVNRGAITLDTLEL